MVLGKRNISDNLSRIVGSEFVVVGLPFLSCVCVDPMFACVYCDDVDLIIDYFIKHNA